MKTFAPAFSSVGEICPCSRVYLWGADLPFHVLVSPAMKGPNLHIQLAADGLVRGVVPQVGLRPPVPRDMASPAKQEAIGTIPRGRGVSQVETMP